MLKMDSESNSQTHWENIPHTEIPHFRTDEQTNREIKKLRSFLKDGDSILDLGCGWGRLTIELAKIGYEVTGVDLSSNLIGYARDTAAQHEIDINYDVGSMLQIPYSNNSFDKIVCMWGVFSHMLTVDDQIQALNEIYRLLKANGAALIDVSNGERKWCREMIKNQGYGHENRVCKFIFKEIPNILYLHDQNTLRKIAEQSLFDRFVSKFQNVNGRRRLVLYLYKY